MGSLARICGVLSPVVTPFDAELRPEPERFASHCRWLLDQGVGLAVFGTNSEANSMSVAEKIALLDALIDVEDKLEVLLAFGVDADGRAGVGIDDFTGRIHHNKPR